MKDMNILSRSQKIHRIINLGDSFTCDQYVNTGENYSEILEDMLNMSLKCTNISKFEVLNLGVGGYDLEYSVERFIKRGKKYNPDLVIWLINNWDFQKINELYLPLLNELYKKGVPEFQNDNSGYLTVVAGNQAIKEIVQKYGLEYILSYQRNSIDKIYNNYKGNLLILSFNPFTQIYNKLISDLIMLQNSYKFFDKLLEDFWFNDKYRLIDGHPNSMGHKKIAENIFQNLHKNYLQDCQIKNNSTSK